jgi:hypothetical protein
MLSFWKNNRECQQNILTSTYPVNKNRVDRHISYSPLNGKRRLFFLLLNLTFIHIQWHVIFCVKYSRCILIYIVKQMYFSDDLEPQQYN